MTHLKSFNQFYLIKENTEVYDVFHKDMSDLVKKVSTKFKVSKETAISRIISTYEMGLEYGDKNKGFGTLD